MISRIELLSRPNADEFQLKILKDFISVFIVFGLDENVILKSIEIRKARRIKLPDAVIAATAQIKNLTLLTRNLKDFEKIAGISA